MSSKAVLPCRKSLEVLAELGSAEAVRSQALLRVLHYLLPENPRASRGGWRSQARKSFCSYKSVA